MAAAWGAMGQPAKVTGLGRRDREAEDQDPRQGREATRRDAEWKSQWKRVTTLRAVGGKGDGPEGE